MKKSFLVALAVVAVSAGSAFAQVNVTLPTEFGSVSSVNVDNSAGGDALTGMVTNDIMIDFTGQYTGSQALLTLTSGAIYQDANGGSDSPPNSAFIGVFPSLAFDSFFTTGSATAGGAFGEPLLVGAAVNLGGDAPEFADAPVNQTWSAAPGSDVVDQSGFLTSRITLSGDANGSLQYVASVNGALSSPVTIPVINGVVGIPEPSSIALLGLGLVGLIGLRFRRK